MPGLYDLFPEGALSNIGFGANANQMVPQMNQGAPQGILAGADPEQERLKALGGLGRMLMIAGSQDPAKAAIAFQQNELSQADERRKLAEDKKKKFSQIGKTPFFTVQAPDGTFAVVDEAGNPVQGGALQKYLLDQQQREADLMKNKIDYTADANVRATTTKKVAEQNLERAGGPQASAEFSPEVASNIEKLQGVAEWLKKGGDNVPLLGNNPMAADIADRTWGRAGFTQDANKNYEQRRYMDQFIGMDVLDAANSMKGALSDKDVRFLRSIRPKSDDPTEMKIRYMNEFAARLRKNEEERVSAARAVQAGPAGAAGATKFVVPGLSEGASKYFSK